MLAEASGIKKIILICGYTDLRYGIDGLAQQIGTRYNINPFQKNVLFLFCGRRLAEGLRGSGTVKRRTIPPSDGRNKPHAPADIGSTSTASYITHCAFYRNILNGKSLIKPEINAGLTSHINTLTLPLPYPQTYFSDKNSLYPCLPEMP